MATREEDEERQERTYRLIGEIVDGIVAQTCALEALRAAFRETSQRHPFKIGTIVVLPDHLHAVWTLPDGVPILRCAGS
ncbi:hypothetical protein [Bradyrhizobium yuanmingense]|uniref:hypothetical protein n=1 Tax=Bradyrhizobium yuanmingense TaxID=108015 RepID=UPI0023B9AEC0|nr:hypothetical protein [Bradyrhizobium yuanmingense]MDF0494401.1 hypothetical protein [Bradyrhizobium yuanmingense]